MAKGPMSAEAETLYQQMREDEARRMRLPPCERPMVLGQIHPRYPSGWCVACGAAPEEGCIRGGPTAKYPDRPYCKDDQTCCDFICGN